MSTGVFSREQGSGPAVVCLHSNASSSSQWRALMDRLAPRFRVIAADSYGAGKSPAWPSDRDVTLDDEVDLIEPVLEQAGDSLSLVGHSYGGAVALKAALRYPQRVRAICLYEPTLFALVDQQQPRPNATEGIDQAVDRAAAALDAGDDDRAAREFIDFWMGEGAWAAMPAARKPAIVAAGRNVRGWRYALRTETATLAQFAALDVPVLYMSGKRSPESAHAVTRVLTPALQMLHAVEFAELGHMAPVTNPEPVNAEIERFLLRHAAA